MAPNQSDSGDRWSRLENIFHAALDLPAEERPAFLDHACGTDAPLRRDVESLLAHHGAGDSLLERPALDHAGLSIRATQSTLSVNTSFGPYRILAPLGAGGIGEVFRARDTRLGRDVALKTLTPTLARDRAYVDRFRREARVLASLNHPNVATLYGFEEFDGIFAIAMELVEGQTLASRLETGRLPVAESLAIARQVADGLEAAHAKGIVHRDLKPTNVLIATGGQAKILDFGLAKRTQPVAHDDSLQTAAPTAAGAILGTPGYMSPEQALGAPVDMRSDIFSFGAVLYQMLTGKKAFASSLGSVVQDEPAPAQEIPERLDRIVRRCLRKNPDERYQSVGELKSALAEVTVNRLAVTPRRIAIAAAIVAATVVSWYLGTHASPQAPIIVTPLTAFSPRAMHHVLSSDGKTVAYASDNSNGNSDIYVQGVTSAAPIPLTTDAAAETHPVWSPDGRSIAFSRLLDPTGALFAAITIPAAGGTEHSLGTGLTQDWSPDGSTLLVLNTAAGESPGFFLVSIADGATRRLTISAAPMAPVLARYSPDGRNVFFIEAGPSRSQVSRVPALGGSPEVVPIYGPQIIDSFAWIAGGSELVIAAGSKLYRVPAAGGQAGLLPFGEGATFVTTSRHAGSLIFGRQRPDRNGIDLMLSENLR